MKYFKFQIFEFESSNDRVYIVKMSQKSTCEISTVFLLVFPRVCSRPTSGTQLCFSCMITAHQNQWVQSWESIETTFGYLQTPGFSRSISSGINWHLGTTCWYSMPDHFSFSYFVFMTFVTSLCPSSSYFFLSVLYFVIF